MQHAQEEGGEGERRREEGGTLTVTLTHSLTHATATLCYSDSKFTHSQTHALSFWHSSRTRNRAQHAQSDRAGHMRRKTDLLELEEEAKAGTAVGHPRHPEHDQPGVCPCAN